MTESEIYPDDNSRLERLVASKAAELAEHFDSVRIFVTFPGRQGSTNEYSHGCGNFCAQYGQVSCWLERQMEYVRDDARRECESDPDGENES